MSARLYVVGVGPGDPELMTLKAVRAIEAADIVAYPSTSTGSFAARIAAAHMRSAEEMPFHVPMSNDGAAEAAYDEAATAIDGHLAAGRSVALLCEGDPMLYGSAASITARLAGRANIEIVPGVPAATACAAAAGISLVRGDTPLTILPATADPTKLRRALAEGGALVLYKVGRHFDSVAALIRGAGRNGTLIVRATCADEHITLLAEAEPGPKPYFSTILLPAAALTTRPKAETEEVAVVVLGPSALPAARRAKAAIAATGRPVRIHGLAGRVEPDAVDTTFAGAAHHLETLHLSGVAIVGLCATGILIRSLAPALRDKTVEPPVVALADDGGVVVPLLGAHHGGTRLAATLAAAFGVEPALTSLSDTHRSVPLDDPPAGWLVANRAPFKALAAAVGRGEGITSDAPFLADLPRGPHQVRLTTRFAEDADTVPTYVARSVTLGMGAERGADPNEAISAIAELSARHRIDPRAIACVVTLDRKADEPAIQAVADMLRVPLRVFDAATLAAEDERLMTPSETVRLAVGVAGVAEAAALAAAGPDASLIVPKIVVERLTFALAEAPGPVGPVGRARGRVSIVGIGPGKRAWRTAESVAAITEAEALVGYSLYLDLVEDLRAHQTRHDFPLGDEAARVRFALERAAEGRDVALVCSGDPGIYAMATLAMELLDTADLPDAAQRVDIKVVPGVSAAQAAAARIGAPLGHDFAFISLSDLMTPWPTIARRLMAAAAADFAVALYNPRSQRRTEQLGRALDIFRGARGAATPVVLASNVGREAEAIRVTTLAALDPEDVDMLTTVIIGASTTRQFTRGDGRTLVYTPRGYTV